MPQECLKYFETHWIQISLNVESGGKWKVETFISISMNHFRTNKCFTSISNQIAHEQSTEMETVCTAWSRKWMKLSTRETKTIKYGQINSEIRNNWNIFDLGIFWIGRMQIEASNHKYGIESLKIVFGLLVNFYLSYDDKMQIIGQNTLCIWN